MAFLQKVAQPGTSHPFAELVSSNGDKKILPPGKKFLLWRFPSAVAILLTYPKASPALSQSSAGETRSRVFVTFPAESQPPRHPV